MPTDGFVTRTHRTVSEGTSTIGVDVGSFGPDGSMFGVVTTPNAAPVAGLVICPPVHSEFLANYRREVLLARSLAARGFVVARFHYPGTGHSQGQDRDLTFGSMRRAAMEAVSWLRLRYGVDVVGLLGTRLSTLTAGAASAVGAGPLVLWDPILEGDRYFREVFRIARMSELARGSGRSARDRFEDVDEAGSTDVVGFRIDRALVESFQDRDLLTLLGPTCGPVLLVQMDPSRHLRPDLAAFVGALTHAEVDVDVRLIEGREGWWFPGTQAHGAAEARNRLTVEATCEWLAKHIPAEVVR